MAASPKSGSGGGFVPFAYGFRPFFLVAGGYAVLGIAAWTWLFVTGSAPFGNLPAHLWHAHEMLFGFVVAAIAGFMLTAVPSWTGERGFAGLPLMILFVLWLTGRIAMASGGWLPASLLVAGELAFLPALAMTIAPSLLRSRNRNRPLLAVLCALWLADCFFVYAVIHGDLPLATTALRTTLNVVLLLITIVGGRIVPAFTANALRQRGVEFEIRSRRWLELTVVAAMLLLIAADIAAPGHGIAATIAGIAAAAHWVRLAGWRGLRTRPEPIVWVLHAAYLWLPVGLGLKAVYLLTGASWAAYWLHALSVGAAATMILAVMTRALLGHTGRPLAVGRAIAWSYRLLIAAAAVRVFGPALLPLPYLWVAGGSSALWVLAFTLYLVVYGPVLLRPRVDGKTG